MLNVVALRSRGDSLLMSLTSTDYASSVQTSATATVTGLIDGEGVTEFDYYGDTAAGAFAQGFQIATSGPIPMRSVAPGRRLASITSARAASARTSARPSGSRVSTQTERLLKFRL